MGTETNKEMDVRTSNQDVSWTQGQGSSSSVPLRPGDLRSQRGNGITMETGKWTRISAQNLRDTTQLSREGEMVLKFLGPRNLIWEKGNNILYSKVVDSKFKNIFEVLFNTAEGNWIYVYIISKFVFQ